MSSILSTSSCGEGTHTTSLPDWPTSGVYSALGAWAKVQTVVAEKIRIDNHRLAERHTDMFLLQLVGVKRKGPRQGLSLAGPTSRRRDDGPASPGSSTSATRQPLQLPGRYCGGTSVPPKSVGKGEPQRQLLTSPPGVGKFPVLSSGARVRLWKSILRSLNPRNDALMTPSSLVEIESTYW